MLVLPEGVRHMLGYLDRASQEALVEDICAVGEGINLTLRRVTMP